MIYTCIKADKHMPTIRYCPVAGCPGERQTQAAGKPNLSPGRNCQWRPQAWSQHGKSGRWMQHIISWHDIHDMLQLAGIWEYWIPRANSPGTLEHACKRNFCCSEFWITATYILNILKYDLTLLYRSALSWDFTANDGVAQPSPTFSWMAQESSWWICGPSVSLPAKLPRYAKCRI